MANSDERMRTEKAQDDGLSPLQPASEFTPLQSPRFYPDKVLYKENGGSGIYKTHFQFHWPQPSNNSTPPLVSNGTDVCLSGQRIEKGSLQRSLGHQATGFKEPFPSACADPLHVCATFVRGYQDIEASRSCACHVGLSGGCMNVIFKSPWKNCPCVSCQQWSSQAAFDVPGVI